MRLAAPVPPRRAAALWALTLVLSPRAALAGTPGAAWAGPWETVAARYVPPTGGETFLERALIYTLAAIIVLVLVYTARHYVFTLNRLLGRQRHPYALLDTLQWPSVTVFVPCHNEEAVVGTNLEALLRVDYPHDRLTVVPVNDRSQDGTRAIIDAYAARYPGRIQPFHREGGHPGKSAALREATERVTSDVILIFDADYVPGRDIVKRLAVPFADPEVGAVMGRVVPINAGANLLTRLVELERTGGYQVDQQARMNLRLVPQYGGTVGGIRPAALAAVGGWSETALTEDTDATVRLLDGGWTVAYVNRAECYEESPETWPVRIRQIRRWARGHTAVATSFTRRLAASRVLRPRERLDAALLMGVYAMSPVLLVGWAIATLLFYLGAHPLNGLVAVLAVSSYNTVGNFAAFFEIATGARLDGTPHRIRLLPLNLLGFIVSLVATARAVMAEVLPGGAFVWHKTERFRQNAPTAPTVP